MLQVESAANAIGADATLSVGPRRQHTIQVFAPEGRSWACEPGTTCLVAEWNTPSGEREAITDLLERMQMGLLPRD